MQKPDEPSMVAKTSPPPSATAFCVQTGGQDPSRSAPLKQSQNPNNVRGTSSPRAGVFPSPPPGEPCAMRQLGATPFRQAGRERMVTIRADAFRPDSTGRKRKQVGALA